MARRTLTPTERTALDALQPAADGRTYVCIGPFCWGKSRDPREAIRLAESNRARIYEGKAGWRYVLYEAPAAAQVSEIDGSLTWTWGETEQPPAPATEVHRHRMPETEITRKVRGA